MKNNYSGIVCAPWCTVKSHEAKHDPACWGADREVNLSLEEGYPVDALPENAGEFGAPHVGTYAYRRKPGCQQVVYLHMCRPSDNQHLDIDASVHLTVEEAITLAQHLLDAVEEIGGAR